MKSYTTAQVIQILARNVAVLNIRAESENKPYLAHAAKNLYKFGIDFIGSDNTLKPVEVIALIKHMKGEG